ncbi:MAG TPA: hypothetical protein VFM46_16070, partial [Pseudomonadales bacterium]|nr:hypothetical protein [Pseudomonadales bacterium]
MSLSRCFKFSSLFCCLIPFGSLCAADRGGAGDDIFQFHGFAAQAILHTSDNSFGGRSDDALSSDYNELGANFAYQPRHTLRLSAQAVTRNAGGYDVGTARLDYFQLDYAFISSGEDKAGVRLGRIKNNFGFYNSTRDVAHTRPSIYLPHNIYWEPVRDMLLARDGGSLYWDAYRAAGMLSTELGYGKPQITPEMATETLFFKVNHVSTRQPKLALARLAWEDGAGEWRFAMSALTASSGLDVGLVGDFDARYVVTSLQFSRERWQLTSEFVWFNYDLKMDPLTRNSYGDSAYLQYNYFISAAWQWYARYDVGYFDRQHRNGSSFEPFLPRFAAYSRDVGTGLRWDLDAHWMLAAELHYIEGGLALSIVDNPDMWQASKY